MIFSPPSGAFQEVKNYLYHLFMRISILDLQPNLEDDLSERRPPVLTPECCNVNVS